MELQMGMNLHVCPIARELNSDWYLLFYSISLWVDIFSLSENLQCLDRIYSVCLSEPGLFHLQGVAWDCLFVPSCSTPK